METEGKTWEQTEKREEELEEEESSPLVRKSRTESSYDVESSNGISENNGHATKSLVPDENGAQDEESNLEWDEQKREEVYGFLETTNGKQKPGTLVFFDQDEGIWKCRICTWTYRNGSVCVDHIWNHKGQLHKLMNVQTLDFETEGVDSTTYSGDNHIEKDSGHGKSGISSPDVITPNTSSVPDISNGNGKHVENDSISISKVQTSEITPDEQTTSYKSAKDVETADVELINEDDLESTDLDVEGVLQKQNTHDLFCPNCNSCITRRVILRKRKRRVRVSAEEVKRNKIEAGVDSTLGAGSVQDRGDRTQPASEDGAGDMGVLTAGNEREKGPDLFRCLSCFSLFIPTGNGFKLFRIFGDKTEKNNIRDEQVPAAKQNWFTSMFGSTKHEAAVEQGSRSQTDMRKSDVGVATSSNIGDQSGQPSMPEKVPVPSHAADGLTETSRKNDEVGSSHDALYFPRQEPAIPGKLIIGPGDNVDRTTTETISTVTDHLLGSADATKKQDDAQTNDQLMESKSNKDVQVNGEGGLSKTTPPMKTPFTNGESTGDSVSFPQKQGGLKLLISSNIERPSLDNPDGSQVPTKALQSGDTDKEDSKLPPTSVSVVKVTDVDSKLNISVSIPHETQHVGATIVTQSVENKTTNFFGSIDSVQVHGNEYQHIINKTKLDVHTEDSYKVDSISSVGGKDTIITIDTQPAVSSQTAQGFTLPEESASVIQSTTQISIADRERTERRKVLQIEVIKSIVYGGLAESITSLSIVSSASGGNAATLNILALGMANLIGGLFIICHNLWELRSDQPTTQLSNQIDEPGDRYRELLGRRENFVLHAVVSILSYIVFGLVPPVVYGFSFWKSDDKEFKLFAVAAASLVCIVLLATGRAYVQRPPKAYLKSVVTFVMLGFMVSGVAYAAGIFVERIVQQLGLFQSSGSEVPNLLLPEMISAGSSWSSY